MKAKKSTRGASKKQPCTGCGNKGITHYMQGKPDAKAAFVKRGDSQKPATGSKYSKKK